MTSPMDSDGDNLSSGDDNTTWGDVSKRLSYGSTGKTPPQTSTRQRHSSNAGVVLARRAKARWVALAPAQQRRWACVAAILALLASPIYGDYGQCTRACMLKYTVQPNSGVDVDRLADARAAAPAVQAEAVARALWRAGVRIFPGGTDSGGVTTAGSAAAAAAGGEAVPHVVRVGGARTWATLAAHVFGGGIWRNAAARLAGDPRKEECECFAHATVTTRAGGPPRTLHVAAPLGTAPRLFPANNWTFPYETTQVCAVPAMRALIGGRAVRGRLGRATQVRGLRTFDTPRAANDAGHAAVNCGLCGACSSFHDTGVYRAGGEGGSWSLTETGTNVFVSKTL